jgi:4-amino-4-deoxy-L-arabinose transferase-like glycosyltransferase
MRSPFVGPSKLSRAVWCALAVVAFAVVLAIRIRLLSMPLERDEGEYAYAGQLMLQGIPPYNLAYNMKFPGTYAAYAGIMSIFGQTTVGIHLGLLVINAATVLLIFLLGRRLIDSTAGLAAAVTYAILSVSPSALGLAAHATHFVVLPVLGGTLLLLNRSERHALARLLAGGLLFGLGFLMKQPALFLVLFGAAYLLVDVTRRHIPRMIARSCVFAAGVIFPFAVTCITLWMMGVFDKFWFWTINYGREYATLVPLSQAVRVFADSVRSIIGAAWPVWVLAGAGLISGAWDPRSRSATFFLFGLLLFSFLAVCPGFYFRYHYFILVLPAVSLLAGVAISKLANLSAGDTGILRAVALLLLAVAVGLPLAWQHKLFFKDSPVEACRALYPGAPFPESIRIAQYVREHTDSTDTIAVLGSEPQIYFYAKRHSATGYIYMYGLMEPHRYAQQMQAEMIRGIEAARPKYLISIVMEDSWLARRESDRQIFVWANQYTAQYYEVAGFVNMISPDKSDYYFDEVPSSVPQLGNYILLYKRKS